MFSTYVGAKKHAKSIQKLLLKSHIIFPLSKCQETVAVASGFTSWHDLVQGYKEKPHIAQTSIYWDNLLRSLPQPCLSPVQRMLDGDFEGSEPRLDGPEDNWFLDVYPYCLAMEVCHRSRTAILKPGSGKRQKLRHLIVFNVLMNCELRKRPQTLLYVETLKISVQGRPETLLPETSQKPDFDQALEELVDNNIISLDGDYTSILSAYSEAFKTDFLSRAFEDQKLIKPFNLNN